MNEGGHTLDMHKPKFQNGKVEFSLVARSLSYIAFIVAVSLYGKRAIQFIYTYVEHRAVHIVLLLSENFG